MTSPVDPSVAALIGQLDAIVSEIYAEWDKDNDSRVGKMLSALMGNCPAYRADITQFRAKLESLQTALAEERERDEARARLDEIDKAARADATDLAVMRDGSKLSRAGLVSAIVYQQQDLADAHARAETAETALSQAQEALTSKDDVIAIVELERDYYRAIVHGTWPDADALIAMKRARLPQGREMTEMSDLEFIATLRRVADDQAATYERVYASGTDKLLREAANRIEAANQWAGAVAELIRRAEESLDYRPEFRTAISKAHTAIATLQSRSKEDK